MAVVHWVLNELTDFPKCEVCGNPVIGTNVKSCFAGYKHLFCSKKCRYIVAHKNAAETNIKRYGFASPAQNKAVGLKISKIQLAFSDEKKRAILAKREATCMTKYGTTNGGWTEEAQKKIKQHFKEKIGSESWAGSKEFKTKVRETCRGRYGSDSWFGSAEFREKIPSILMKKYGVTNTFKLPEARVRRAIAALKRLYVSLSEGSSNVIPLFSESELLDLAIKDGKSVSSSVEFPWKCPKCGVEFTSKIDWNGFHRRKFAAWCPTCFPPLAGRSKVETEFAMFIGSIDPTMEVRVNVRDVITPLELDVYVPSKKIAFEFDGLFYHSESASRHVECDYHLRKTEMCEKIGIHLIHVFENEWMKNPQKEIVQARIKAALGQNGGIAKIEAHECYLDERLGKTKLNEFLDSNHLQGHCRHRSEDAAIGLRLKLNDELISVMLFSKSRLGKKLDEWELVRFCDKMGFQVSEEAIGKMLSHFEQTYHPRSLVSYADRRWTMNNGEDTVYDKLGFKLDHATSPDYWYWKEDDTRGLCLESRQKYQKHRLSKVLEVFDPSKTEVENMLDNGYHMIYDCGGLVYSKACS